MGKWTELLAANLPDTPAGPTDKTDKRGVTSVLAVPMRVLPAESRGPGAAANDAAPIGLYRLSRADADRCHAQPWTDDDCARFVSRVSRFRQLGIGAADADDLAERLHLRDVDGDDMHACTECQRLRGHLSTGLRCTTPKAAGLMAGELSTELAVRLQRCPAFSHCRP